MKQILLILVTATTLLASCDFVGGKRVKGNGNMKTEDRSETGFTGVKSMDNLETYVGIGPFSVKIEGEDNLIPYIETYVENGILHISTEDGFNLKPRRSLKVYVTAPRLNKIHASGNGGITSTTKITDSTKVDIDVSGNAVMKLDVDAPAIDAELTGNGGIDIVGQARDFQCRTTGNGNIDAGNLQTENTKVEILGNGEAVVAASVKLDVRIGGNGDVRYKGNPQTSTNITGNGSLKKID
ncbi:head GIN domain-containing protein [Paraflavitalea sp. CAU 1676]|uniref:head GIN domain-containing protein n=1 Tax=Paraflavitalea sp. CAU 1676 TaxID=3032598 RepID=UPI0023DA05C3|nr:head GIN domain-containing protein [Paraflavitalea sp. CAU 1676]MDF2189445.1 DUF2807 domain-containing protein [Paraflavitalea sp. CAU 1676]